MSNDPNPVSKPAASANKPATPPLNKPVTPAQPQLKTEPAKQGDLAVKHQGGVPDTKSSVIATPPVLKDGAGSPAPAVGNAAEIKQLADKLLKPAETGKTSESPKPGDLSSGLPPTSGQNDSAVPPAKTLEDKDPVGGVQGASLTTFSKEISGGIGRDIPPPEVTKVIGDPTAKVAVKIDEPLPKVKVTLKFKASDYVSPLPGKPSRTAAALGGWVFCLGLNSPVPGDFKHFAVIDASGVLQRQLVEEDGKFFDVDAKGNTQAITPIPQSWHGFVMNWFQSHGDPAWAIPTDK